MNIQEFADWFESALEEALEIIKQLWNEIVRAFDIPFKIKRFIEYKIYYKSPMIARLKNHHTARSNC